MQIPRHERALCVYMYMYMYICMTPCVYACTHTYYMDFMRGLGHESCARYWRRYKDFATFMRAGMTAFHLCIYSWIFF